MKRCLFSIAAGLSLLLCGGSVALWVRSNMWADAIVYSTSTTDGMPLTRVAESRSGRFAFWVRVGGFPMRTRWTYHCSAVGRGDDWRFLSFSYDGYTWCIAGFEFGPGKTVIPHWFLVACTAFAPVIWIRLRGRRLTKHCPTCGYDLRATPERCPECGTVAPASRARANINNRS